MDVYKLNFENQNIVKTKKQLVVKNKCFRSSFVLRKIDLNVNLNFLQLHEDASGKGKDMVDG